MNNFMLKKNININLLFLKYYNIYYIYEQSW